MVQESGPARAGFVDDFPQRHGGFSPYTLPMTRPLPRTFLLACLLPVTTLFAAQDATLVPAFSLNQLAAKIADGPAPLRTELASLALAELADIYADEAAHALQDQRKHPSGSGLRNWAAGVQKLADDYASLARSINPMTPVELGIGPEGSLQLIVNNRLVVASSPRMNRQAAYEQRVVNRFCELNRCADIMRDMMISWSGQPVTDTGNTQWVFSDRNGPTCRGNDGLELQFGNTLNLGQKRELCARTVDELNRLASAIRQRSSGGIIIDWNLLTIHDRPEPEQHKVVLNQDGEALLLPLPVLAAHAELFRMVRPWLAARVRNDRLALVIINAGRLLAAPGQSLDE